MKWHKPDSPTVTSPPVVVPPETPPTETKETEVPEAADDENEDDILIGEDAADVRHFMSYIGKYTAYSNFNL